MAYTDTKVSLILNKMTKSQYDTLLNENKISSTELYFITDDNDKYYLKNEVYTKNEIETKLENYYTHDQIAAILNDYVKTSEIKTINGQSIIGTGDITITGGGDASIDDITISTESTYSSSKIDSTYLKAPEGILDIPNGRINLTNNINSIYSITNDEVVMNLNDDGLSYHSNEKNLDVNITPYYGGSDQTVDPATIKVNGIGLARETELNKKVGKSGDIMTGNLTAPAFTIDATTAATGDKALNDGSLVFKYKNSNDELWYAWLTMDSRGQLQFASHGGLTSEISTVATQDWVKKRVANAYIYKGSVDTYDALPSGADPGDVYNVKSNGANYAWTGTEWDELGATVNLAGYALKTDIPSLAGYATESWVESKNYLTEHQSLTEYAKKSDLTPYATQEWVDSKGYLTEHQSLDGKQDVLVSGNNIKTINGESILGEGNITLSTESGASIDDTAISTSSTYSSSKIDTTYAKKEEYDRIIPTDITVNANKMYLYHNGTEITGQTPVEFKTIGGVSVFGSGNIEMSSGGTTVEANPTLYGNETVLTGIKIADTKYSIPNPNLDNYALKSEVPSKVSDLPNDAGYTKTVIKFIKWED